ncbi:MAG TPA: tetratricopeptide repeat protein [Gemmataceae bacterium]|nr:tetratricopeptide repeat protein [Gemmataceae bacterium]
MSRPARVRLALLAALLLVGAGAAAYYLWPRGAGPEPVDDPPAPDPRLTFDTPFRNVRPDVGYVGDAACAPCHQDIDHTYHRHPMGRSAFVLPAPPGVERYDEKTHPTFTALDHIDYRIDRQDGRVFHTETVRDSKGTPAAVTRVEAAVAIGSGTRGRSYLCNRDGAVYQSGISWFSEKQVWDVSPGFTGGRHAQRPVIPGCLFCHVDRVDPVPRTVNRFREPLLVGQANIGCERCHGPGALHVAERTGGQPITGVADTSIVNPKRLSAGLREDICRQCHLQGEVRILPRDREVFDYRPGLPLDLFVRVFVRHPALTDYHKSVGQVEQMRVSKCFTGSVGKLGCTSCHDPHATPAADAKDAFYRARCLACHQDRGCTLPTPERQAKGDACAVCHMPKAASANIAHTAVTDHRVPRVPPPPKAAAGALPPGELPVVRFPGAAESDADPGERDRDLGVALAALARQQPGDAAPAVLSAAVPQLTAATDRHPGDVAAWEALAEARAARGEWADALAAAERVLARHPGREEALQVAAEAAVQLRQLDRAAEYARRAADVNPGRPDHRVRLAEVLVEQEQFAAAAEVLRGVLAAWPNHGSAHGWLAVCLYQQGQARAALAEIDTAVRIDPSRADAVRSWFRARTR